MVEEFYYKDRKIIRFVSSSPTIYILGTSEDACDYKFENWGGDQGFEILNAVVNSIEFTGKHCVGEGNFISGFPLAPGEKQSDRLKCCPGLIAAPPSDGLTDVEVCRKYHIDYELEELLNDWQNNRTESREKRKTYLRGDKVQVEIMLKRGCSLEECIISLEESGCEVQKSEDLRWVIALIPIRSIGEVSNKDCVYYIRIPDPIPAAPDMP